MNNNQTIQNSGAQAFCAKTFEAGGKPITNFYLCRQPQFTMANSWNLLRQRRKYPRTQPL